MSKITTTIQYYNDNAESFRQDTINADMHVMQDWFLSFLKDGSSILDLGCGTGRDTKYFLDNGFDVTAIDGSIEMCKIASSNTGLQVRQLLFDDIDYIDRFDAVWACASLLHVPYDELPEVFDKIKKALKRNGIFYASFKNGTFQGQRNGRFYTDLTEEALKELIQNQSNFSIIEYRESLDVRPGRSNEVWINIIMKKI